MISIVIYFKTYHEEGNPLFFAILAALATSIVSLFLFLTLYDSIKIIATTHTMIKKLICTKKKMHG